MLVIALRDKLLTVLVMCKLNWCVDGQEAKIVPQPWVDERQK